MNIPSLHNFIKPGKLNIYLKETAENYTTLIRKKRWFCQYFLTTKIQIKFFIKYIYNFPTFEAITYISPQRKAERYNQTTNNSKKQLNNIFFREQVLSLCLIYLQLIL